MKTEAAANVILITIDCLRADHLGCYGYGRDTSPFIDGLAAKGASFRQAISNGGGTPEAFPSIMGSRLSPLDPDEYTEIMKHGPTLAGSLSSAGYQTAGFLANAFLSRFYGYDSGFHVFEDDLGIIGNTKKRRQKGRRVILQRGVSKLRRLRISLGNMLYLALLSLGKQRELPAGELTDRAIQWLDGTPGNFFLWPHYMDAHHPYLPPPEHVRHLFGRRLSRRRMVALYAKQLRSFRDSEAGRSASLPPSEVGILEELYDAAVKVVDDNIGRLFDSLGSRLDDTLLIVTSDHGEEFGEHGSLGHRSTLYEEMLHVPLIIAGPGVGPHTVVREPVQLMDLAPTITALAGIGEVPGFRGKSLSPIGKGPEADSEGIIAVRLIPESTQRLLSYRTASWKYIVTQNLEDGRVLREEVYSLRADPGESRDLHGSGDEEVTMFERTAIDKIEEFRLLKQQRQPAPERARIRARLKRIPRP